VIRRSGTIIVLRPCRLDRERVAAGIRPPAPLAPDRARTTARAGRLAAWSRLRSPPVQVLPGTAAIGATGASLQEFWAWALSDLRTNTARSRLAEYLVAVALNVHRQPRVEWDSHDVTAPDGTRVEVKSSAYLQAWDQARLSPIRFGGLRARTWSAQAGRATDVTYNADVYVFAVQTAKTHETYDALNLDQWRFWVASAVTIAETGQDQVSLSRVQALCGDHVEHCELAGAIAAAARTQPNPASA
jgi:hypothetical protein